MTGSSASPPNGSQQSMSNAPATTISSSDPVGPSSDPLALPSSSSVPAAAVNGKKLFPLFGAKTKKKDGKLVTASQGSAHSDAESATGSQNGSKNSVKASSASGATASNTKGKAKSNTASDASSSTGQVNGKAKKTCKVSTKVVKNTLKTNATSKRKSKSPIIDIDDDLEHDHHHESLEQPNSTTVSASTVASTSSPITPPLQPHKHVITILDSPVRETRPSGKTFADFAAERVAKKTFKDASGWNGGRLPLWPSRESMLVCPEDQSCTFTASSRPPKIDWKGKGRATEADLLVPTDTFPHFPSLKAIEDIYHRYTTLGSAPSKDTDNINKETLDAAYLQHLQKLSAEESAEGAQQLWYSRYAPSRACEVLGETNKRNAYYLRDWLQELMLQDPMKIAQNSRKRKVKREVTSDERKRLRKAAKRRKRKGARGSNMFDDYDDDGMDDFIADDDEEDFEHYDYYDLPDDDNSSVPSPTKSTASSAGASDNMHLHPAAGSNNKRSRFEPLTNVILLAGPTASGKTSTAYAVANELQWQVFEVYPGIGKRGYKDIERYVGMVGDNHIMKRDTPTIASIFGKPSTSSTSTSSASSTSKNGPKPDAITNGTGASKATASQPPVTGKTTTTTTTTSVIKQSFILIEEVDLLYGSDSGFWEGLINFISKSRRPVILTCNDMTSIPKDSIPLQCVLEFESLDEGTIKNILKHVADAEVLEVKQEDIAKIVQDTFTDGYPDIRKALNQLQCVGGSLNSTSGTRRGGAVEASESKESLKIVQALLENASFADAELSRRIFMSFEDEERAPQPEKEDDEALEHPALPVHKLPLPIDMQPCQPLPCYGREEEFCAALGVSCDADVKLNGKQWSYCNGLHSVAEEYLDEHHIHPSNVKIHQDILPMLREIVYRDDIQEQAYNIALEISADDVILDPRKRRSRRLAGAGKESYKRHLEMVKEVADAIRSSGKGLLPLLKDGEPVGSSLENILADADGEDR